MGCKYWKRDSVLGEYHCTAPAEESEQEYLEQRIDELLSANGSLQYKNDRLTAKTQRLEVAEKMAREARAQLAAAEQRAETLKDERDMYDARATEYWEDVLELSDKLEDAEQRAEKAEKELLILREGIEAVRTLIDNSTAVIGLHLNGDAAEWESLQKGGFFESWLADFNDAEVISNRSPQHFEGE